MIVQDFPKRDAIARVGVDPVFDSRHFRIDDPAVDVIRVANGVLRRRKRVWDLIKLRWWSRPYEYRWLTDSLSAYFGADIADKSVLDAACGADHPGCLMLAKMGFAEVEGFDMYESHPLSESFGLNNLHYRQGDLAEPLGRTYDAVCCISLLEHLDRSTQRVVMENLCRAVAPGGCLLVTFVTPGFEYDTDPEMVEQVLASNGMALRFVPAPESAKMTSRNSRTPYPGWPKLGRDVSSVYRMFGVKA